MGVRGAEGYLNRNELTPDFIAGLYDAAMDEEAWAGLAAKVARVVGVEGGAVMLLRDGLLVDISITDNIRGLAAAPYQDYYRNHDPWLRRAPIVSSGVVTLSSELFPESELIKTEFYNDFARPIGMLRPLTAYAAVNDRVSIALGVEQPFASRLLDEHDKPALAQLLPYLRKMADLRMRLRSANARADTNAAALDALAFGAVICDSSGRVLLANKAADDLARGGSGFVLKRSVISALVQAEAQRLSALIQRAARGESGGSIRLTGNDGVAALFVLITPLPASLGGHRPGYALIALRSARGAAAFKESTLTAMFGLSPVQAAAALALFNGRTPEQIAADRGVSIATVRTHLQEIFVRTGAENQRDLVRLLAILPPLR